ncbi:hypothetical protein [Gordonia sp. SID5947]|uniref:hypothetical protein n=1 Tax=Gordonia sp. SID5947 TaxID=2690315 RepID=UPI0031BAC63E
MLDLADDDTSTTPDVVTLADLVTRAAQADPVAIAVERDGFTLGFGDLEAIKVAMSAGLPADDANAGLTMALMSSVPDLVTAGPGELDSVVRDLRRRAAEVVGHDGGAAAAQTVDGAVIPVRGADSA